MIAPPADVSPERLFSLLIDPAPSLPLKSTLEGFSLRCQAVHAQGWASAWWAAEAAPPEVRDARHARELLSRCLRTEAGDQVTADDLGLLTASELRALTDEALAALAIVGPTYARCDWPSWQARLEMGARHAMNASTGVALAACVDYGHGAVVYRPERFWRVAGREMLDGWWLCFRAARAAWSDDGKPKSVAEALRQAQGGRG